MSAVQSFDETFSEEGGWFDPRNFHQTDRMIIFDWITPQIEKIIQSHIQKSTPYKVEFAYINSYELNAAVKLFAGDDFCYLGMNVGAAVNIFNFFFSALSHPELLLNIGNPKTEVYKMKKIKSVLFNIQSDGSINQTHSSGIPLIDYFPNDQIRLEYARLLSLNAVVFLVEHEIGHLLNGHLELRADHGAKNPLDKLTEQVLEWDADSWATTIAVGRILKHISQSPDEFPEPIRWIYSSFEEDISSWLFSITSLFLLWSSNPFDISNLDEYCHPPAPLRALSIFSTTAECIKNKSSDKYVQKYEEIHEGSDVLKQCIDTFSLLTGNSVYKDEIRKAASKPALSHLDRYISKWKEIRPLLESYAYRNLPD